MPKSEVVGAAQRKQRWPRPAQLQNAVEGQIAEMCRDLAIQAKRMQQLQEQAEELRTVVRQWAGGSDADSSRGPSNRGGRR
jgi:hypothetical protein